MIKYVQVLSIPRSSTSVKKKRTIVATQFEGDSMFAAANTTAGDEACASCFTFPTCE